MNKETKLVKKVYSENVDYEWNRLTKDAFHRLEYDTSWQFLRKYLPKKGLVLDAGGGPGRYTIELAKLGYNVVLLDLVKENLEHTKKEIINEGIEKRVKKIVEGSITDLSWFKDNTFDAILCLGGPLSHVYPESARKRAITEFVRVVKTGAPIISSVIGKYGVLLRTPIGFPEAAANKKLYDCIINTGDEWSWRGSAYCHYFTARDLRRLFSVPNLIIIKMVGLEGLNISSQTTNPFAENHTEAWRNWLKIHERMCTDPFVVNNSNHIMIIVRKK
jgi:SAM-dependent methyltransferase